MSIYLQKGMSIKKLFFFVGVLKVTDEKRIQIRIRIRANMSRIRAKMSWIQNTDDNHLPVCTDHLR
jgi:hypothetical protein